MYAARGASTGEGKPRKTIGGRRLDEQKKEKKKKRKNYEAMWQASDPLWNEQCVCLENGVVWVRVRVRIRVRVRGQG